MTHYVMTVRILNGLGSEAVYVYDAYSESALIDHIRRVLAKPADLIEFTITIGGRAHGVESAATL